MIISANETKDFIASIERLSANDPFACRIISLYNSYSPELAFVDYWMIADDNSGKCTGAIARSGTSFILFLTAESDLEETSAFMRVAGASSVLFNGNFRLELFSGKVVSGVVMEQTEKITVSDSEIKFVSPDIKSVHRLLVSCSDENFKPPVFEDFYVDVNHKLRHGTMRICGIEYEGELAAVAMTVAESDFGAVLGAVSCSPKYRNMGFGSQIVAQLSNELISEGKTVYIHRAKNANAAFYGKLGFKESGVWTEYSLRG